MNGPARPQYTALFDYALAHDTKMSDAELLSELMRFGFELSGQEVPLGFDVNTIRKTIEKLGHGSIQAIEPLFTAAWPSKRFWLGQVELLGPEDINYEHKELLPGCVIVHYGFLAIGTNGCGDVFSYCTGDGRIYLLSHEDFAEDCILSANGEVASSASNIQRVAVRKWDSIRAFLLWTFGELKSITQSGTLGNLKKGEWKGPVSGIVGRWPDPTSDSSQG